MPEIKEFIDLMLDEADCMDDLADVIREQREALKINNQRGSEFVNNLNDLISRDEHNYKCVIAKGILEYLFKIIKRNDPAEIDILKLWTAQN